MENIIENNNNNNLVIVLLIITYFTSPYTVKGGVMGYTSGPKYGG
jgi:hypothetical protein